jgi:hypothetical protein
MPVPAVRQTWPPLAIAEPIRAYTYVRREFLHAFEQDRNGSLVLPFNEIEADITFKPARSPEDARAVNTLMGEFLPHPIDIIEPFHLIVKIAKRPGFHDRLRDIAPEPPQIKTDFIVTKRKT